MTFANAATDAAPLFSVVLRPHRSLSRRGLLLVMGALAAFSLAVGSFFFALGAWPVIGFGGLDVLLAWLAFRASNRSTRAAEVIRVDRDQLTLRRVAANGRAAEVAVNPYWARLEVERHPEFGILRMAIASHGARYAIGRFVPPPERENFVRELGAALARARSTPAPQQA